jgi:hypothetical protein
MKNAVFWDVTSCGCCKDRLSEERIASIIRATRIPVSTLLDSIFINQELQELFLKRVFCTLQSSK